MVRATGFEAGDPLEPPPSAESEPEPPRDPGDTILATAARLREIATRQRNAPMTLIRALDETLLTVAEAMESYDLVADALRQAERTVSAAQTEARAQRQRADRAEAALEHARATLIWQAEHAAGRTRPD